MADQRLQIVNWKAAPDSSGDVFFEPADIKRTSLTRSFMTLVFNDTSLKDGLFGSFKIPEDYVGTPRLSIHWLTSATTGDVDWDFDAQPVALGESGNDATADDETATVNDIAPGTAWFLQEAIITLSATYVVGDIVGFTLSRDGVTEAGGGIAAAVLVDAVELLYADA